MSIQELVSKSLDDIRNDLFGYLSAKQETYAAAGWLPVRINLNKGIVRGLVELWAWGLWQLYQFLAIVLAQAFPDSATGAWLRLHCKQVGVTPNMATKATGTVYFVRSGTAGNVPIAAGRVVRTKPDGAGQVYRYVTTSAVVLPNGATEVAVTVEAEEYGSSANAAVGQICEIATTIPGVDTVENRADWLLSEGNDEESDESLQLRYQLAWKELNGCTKYAYESWARAVTGVVGVKILDQHPRGEGTVDVLIVGSAGLPTPTLLDAVNAKINGTGNDDELRPLNDDVLVRAPTAVAVAITAELELTGGDPAATMAEAENRIRALFSALPLISGVTPLGIGVDVTVDRLVRTALLDNVKRINWTSPAADLPVAADGLAVLESIALTWVYAAEE